MREQHGLAGRLRVELRNTSGEMVVTRSVDNLITTAGRQLLAGYFTGAREGAPRISIAVGSGDDPTSSDDDQLVSEVDRSEAAPPTIRAEVRDGESKVVATVMATLYAKGGEEVQELREAGIVLETPGQNQAVLYNRVTFPVVNKGGNMEMTLTWEVIF